MGESFNMLVQTFSAGDITASFAGNAYFFARTVVFQQNSYISPGLRPSYPPQQSGGACANNHYFIQNNFAPNIPILHQ